MDLSHRTNVNGVPDTKRLSPRERVDHYFDKVAPALVEKVADIYKFDFELFDYDLGRYLAKKAVKC